MATNRYPGKCSACGQWLDAGAGLLGPKVDGRWTVKHDGTCPARPSKLVASPVYAGRSGGVQHASGRNRRAASCDRCGEHIAAGDGSLVRCIEDSGCMQHHDESGWHVYCLVRAECDVRRAAAISAQRERVARAKRASDARRTLRDLVAQGRYHVATQERSTWPAIRETISLGSRMAGSETLYLRADGSACYVESSCDDYHEWVAPVTDALTSAIQEYDEAQVAV